MKQTISKIFCSLLSVTMLFCLSVSALAADNGISDKSIEWACTTYQDILDMLNEEYGTNVHFASLEEQSAYGIDCEKPDISLAEFEQQMRKDIEDNLKANEVAYLASQKLNSIRIEESGEGICKKTRLETPKASYLVTRSKDIAGATAYLSATVNDTSYWHYGSIDSVWTTYLAGYNSTPAFAASTYNCNLIDARRTCALSLYGYTVGNWGVIIDNNAYRYVEFWAGSGMQ